MNSAHASPLLRMYTKIVCLSVFLLLFAGAMVTSHDAGLSVPDWPTTFGHNMFLFPYEKWTGGIFFEHSHRLIASVVGFLILVQAVLLFRCESRREVVRLGSIMLGAVILQGTLGGLTVLYKLPPAISICHGVLAQTIFVLSIVVAYSESNEWFEELNEKNSVRLYSSSAILSFLVFLQLILGALVRHTKSGLAVPDFPTVGGTLFPLFNDAMVSGVNALRGTLGLPEVSSIQVMLHVLHRLGGLVIVAYVFTLLVRITGAYRENKRVMGAAFFLIAVVITQFFLGAFTVLSHKDPIVTSFHVLMGALTLGITTFLTLRIYRNE